MTQAAPIFIVGSQRSGTTLLRLMLDHHPRVACPHEFDYSVALIGDAGELPEVERYRDYLQSSGSFRRSGLELREGLEYRELVEDLLRQHQRGKPMIAMAVHEHFHRLVHLWPDARFIYLVRDPRDVARSVIQMGWAGNAWSGARYWLAAEDSWQRLAREVGETRSIALRYEDLVRDPGAELARMCDFLGIEFAPSMLEYSSNSTYEPPRADLAEQWRTRASERDVRLVEARVGSAMRARGYSSSGLPPLSVQGWSEIALRASDRWGRARFRLRRLGAPLFVAELLARRLGIKGWQDSTRERVLAVQQRYVR